MRIFHFIISITLHQTLQPIAREANLTVNKLIALFVELTLNQIDLLYQEYNKQERSIYENVSNDGIRHAHIKLTRESYEKAKWLHGSHNNYSTAQVVRRCISMMLILIREFGSLDSAVKAVYRLNDVTRKQHESRDRHGIMHNHSGMRQLLGNTYVSYEVVEQYIHYMLL